MVFRIVRIRLLRVAYASCKTADCTDNTSHVSGKRGYCVSKVGV